MSVLDPYDYAIPEDIIAKEPADPRDSARLFVVDASSGVTSEDVFRNVADHVPVGALLVINETKVVPARLILKKETGGKIEVLFSVNEYDGKSDTIEGIVDRKIDVGSKLTFSNDAPALQVISQNENIFVFKMLFPRGEFQNVLEKHGTMPIPPYIKDTPLAEAELRQKYQTVFAKTPASAAAPTASLHFTKGAFESLAKKGIETTSISLHVGLGTFAPIRDENLKENKLHREFFDVPENTAKKIARAKKEGRLVVAVGTTVARALESSASAILSGEPASGSTTIFIRPPFEFRIVDILITNFHVPKSSLMMLVEAFLQAKHSPRGLVEYYKEAISKKYRFFSFGDAMLIG